MNSAMSILDGCLAKSIRSDGFSLIELMVVIAIVGVLTSLAVPAFQRVIAEQRVRTVTSDMASEFAYARAEAVKRGTRVGLATLTGTDWTGGWSIFVDANHNGHLDAGEAILRTHNALNTTLIISTSVTVDTVNFAPDGRIRVYSSSVLNPVSLVFTVDSTARPMTGHVNNKIEFSPSGRVAVNKG